MMQNAAFALALLLATPLLPGGGAAAQDAQDEAARRIVVVGTGEATAAPDMAVMELGVVTEAPTAAEALRANTEAMRRVLEGFRAEGVEPRDLQTSSFFVEPRYNYPQPQPIEQGEPRPPEIIGYAVRNSVTVRIRDLARTGALLDKAVTLGANSISGPNLTIGERGAIEAEARRDAVRAARDKAELYAEAAGVALGPVMRIEDVEFMPPEPMPMARAMKAEAMDSSVPIEGGELTFRAQVRVVWGLGD